MHITLIELIEMLISLMLTAALRVVREQREVQDLMWRMLPPEHRPAERGAQAARREPIRAVVAARKPHIRPLWTPQDCRLELLTEATMHAFDDNGSICQPEGDAANYSPRRAVNRFAAVRAKAERNAHASILLRTLTRNASMLPAGAAAPYREAPALDLADGHTLSYRHAGRADHVREVA